MQDSNYQTQNWQIETMYFIGFGTVSEYFGNIKIMGKKKLKDGILTGVIKLKLYLLKAYMVSNRPLYCRIWIFLENYEKNTKNIEKNKRKVLISKL